MSKMDEATQQLGEEVRADLLRLVQEPRPSGCRSEQPGGGGEPGEAWASLQGLPDLPEFDGAFGSMEFEPPSRIARAIVRGPKPKPRE
jgi:hypothetical protein